MDGLNGQRESCEHLTAARLKTKNGTLSGDEVEFISSIIQIKLHVLINQEMRLSFFSFRNNKAYFKF